MKPRAYQLIPIGVIVGILLLNIFIRNIANLTPSKVLSRYTEYVRVHKYENAYQKCFSVVYRKSINLNDFEKLQNENAVILGFVLNKEILEGRVLRDSEGRKRYVIVAMGFYPSGAFPENYFFTRELSGWKIEGFDIRSHLLDPANQEQMKKFIEGLSPEMREVYENMLRAQGHF